MTQTSPNKFKPYHHTMNSNPIQIDLYRVLPRHRAIQPVAMAKLQAITIALLYHLVAIFVLALPCSASFIGNNGDFDYFVLSLQWPPTYCRGTLNCCKSNACCFSSGPPQLFTIHGLWCNYNDGSWPSCCGNNDFDEKEISTLHRALDAYWPTLSCGSLPTCHGHQGSFYAHEFEKHGTCSASVTGDEYSYFLITLNIYFKYNVTEALNEAGYTPSNSEKYPLGGVIAAIENAFHTSPLVACSGDAIQEIRLCFYKDFKPRECSIINRIGNKVNSLSSCPKFVSLPAYVSSEQNTRLKPAVEAQ